VDQSQIFNTTSAPIIAALDDFDITPRHYCAAHGIAPRNGEPRSPHRPKLFYRETRRGFICA
jgi:hypothetical protein